MWFTVASEHRSDSSLESCYDRTVLSTRTDASPCELIIFEEALRTGLAALGRDHMMAARRLAATDDVREHPNGSFGNDVDGFSARREHHDDPRTT
jgi:hypothetical protein